MKLVVVESKFARGHLCEVAGAVDAGDKVLGRDEVVTTHQKGETLTHLEEGLEREGRKWSE